MSQKKATGTNTAAGPRSMKRNLDTGVEVPGGRAGTPGASYERTNREQESEEDREARFDRQRLRTNHLTPGNAGYLS